MKSITSRSQMVINLLTLSKKSGEDGYGGMVVYTCVWMEDGGKSEANLNHTARRDSEENKTKSNNRNTEVKLAWNREPRFFPEQTQLSACGQLLCC